MSLKKIILTIASLILVLSSNIFAQVFYLNSGDVNINFNSTVDSFSFLTLAESEKEIVPHSSHTNTPGVDFVRIHGCWFSNSGGDLTVDVNDTPTPIPGLVVNEFSPPMTQNPQDCYNGTLLNANFVIIRHSLDIYDNAGAYSSTLVFNLSGSSP